MHTIIGSTINDIKNLKMFDVNSDKSEIVVIPGYITVKNQDKSFTELVQIAKDHNTSLVAIDYFEQQKKLILNGGYGNGKKLEITHNPVYDIIVKALGFNYKQWVRDNMCKLTQKLEDMEEVYSLQRDLERAERHGVSDKIAELREDIQDAKDMIGDLSVVIKKHTGKSSERATIIQVAKEMKLPVKTHDHGDHYLVAYNQDTTKHPKSTGRGGQMTWNIHQWLSTLTPMTPTEPPISIVTGCTDSYFRTVLNKSPYFASYRRGRVTVYPAGITGGQVYLGATPLAPVGATCTTEYLDMVLGPYGYRHDAVMGWERHCVQGGAV